MASPLGGSVSGGQEVGSGQALIVVAIRASRGVFIPEIRACEPMGSGKGWMRTEGRSQAGVLFPLMAPCVPSLSHVLRGRPSLTGDDGSIKGVQVAVVLHKNVQITLKDSTAG